MQAAADATPGGMVSILGLERFQVEGSVTRPRSAGLIQVANLLCPGNIVVSGERAACDGRTARRGQKAAASIGWPSPGRSTPP